jgi:hypothetical protein
MQDLSAIDAIWKTDLENAQEKLVLYHLATRHELGERYTTNWKTLDSFLSEFIPHYSAFKDLKAATQLSDLKLQRTIETLLKKRYIEQQDSADTLHAGGNPFSYAITRKIFEDYRQSTEKKAKPA